MGKTAAMFCLPNDEINSHSTGFTLRVHNVSSRAGNRRRN